MIFPPSNDNSKNIAGLMRITRITPIALVTEEHSNMKLATMIQIMKMCEIHQVQNGLVYVVGDSIVKHVNGHDISRKTEKS